MVGLLLLACAEPPRRTPSGEATTAECGEGTVPDGEGCVPEACGVAPWGPSADAGVYVDANAASGGDGSMDAPYRTLAEAVAVGGTVAVAAGVYAEVLALDTSADGLVLSGRCRELVTLDGSGGGDDEPAVWLDGRQSTTVELGGLTVSGGRYGGVWTTGGALTVHDTTIVDNRVVGAGVTGSGRLTLERVDIAGTLAPRGGEGHGIDQQGGVLSATDVTVTGSEGIAAYLGGGAATLERVELLDTVEAPGGKLGWGLDINSGASAVTRDVRVRGAVQVGVGVTGATLDWSGGEIGDVTANAAGDDGRGLQAVSGAVVALEGATIGTVTLLAVFAMDPSTSVDIVASDVTGRGPTDTGVTGSAALFVQDGAAVAVRDSLAGSLGAFDGGRIDARSVAVVGAVSNAVETAGDGSAVSLDGCEVDDILVTGDEGRWVDASEGATVDVVDSVLSGATHIGIYADTGARVDVRDATLGGVAAVDGAGVFVDVEEGGAVSLDGLALSGATWMALQVRDPGSTLLATGCEVAGTNGSPGPDAGFGLAVIDGAHADIVDSSFDGGVGAGVVVDYRDSSATLDTVTVRGVARSREWASAVGISAQREGTVEAHAVAVEDVAGPGIYVASGAVVCDDCRLTGNRFAGVVLLGGDLALTGGTVEGNEPDASYGGGVGVFVRDTLSVPHLALEGVVVGAHPYAALWVDGEATVSARGCDLTGGDGRDVGTGREHGNAVFVRGVTVVGSPDTGVWLEGNTLQDSRTAVLLEGATAAGSENVFEADDASVRSQRCEGLPAAEGLGEVACETSTVLTEDMDFALGLLDVQTEG